MTFFNQFSKTIAGLLKNLFALMWMTGLGFGGGFLSGLYVDVRVFFDKEALRQSIVITAVYVIALVLCFVLWIVFRTSHKRLSEKQKE